MIKKIGLVILMGIMWFGLSAQSIQKRSSDNVTVEDGRAMFKYNLFIPRYLDTTQANLNRGVDTCYALIATYDSNKIWYRQCNPKKWVIIGSGSGGGTSATDSAAVLKQVTQIATFSRTDVNQISVVDTLRGGIFFKYTGSDTADNGMIFSDANGTKWLRQTTDNIINIRWYGAHSYVVGQPDSYNDMTPYLRRVLQYTKYHKSFSRIHIPAEYTGFQNAYYFLDSVLIDHPISIEGDGTLNDIKTIILFQAHATKGFVIKYEYGGTSFSASLKNLFIATAATWDSTETTTHHAIETNTILYLDNISISSFGGDGVHVSACANVPSGDNNNYGNSDGSVYRNVKVENCNNGFFIEGCDANIIRFEQCIANSNRRWGFYDNGQLGNYHDQPHMAFDGYATAGQRAVVTYGGIGYVALPGYDGYFQNAADSNVNKRPDLNVGTFWEVTSLSGGDAWISTRRYYSGGPLIIVNANATTTVNTPYTEGFQPPMRLGPRTLRINGIDGAGVSESGLYLKALFGTLYMPNGSFKLPTAGQTIEVGKENPYTPSAGYMYQSSGMNNALTLDAATSNVGISFRNSGDGGLQGGIRYVGNDLQSVSGGTPIAYWGVSYGYIPVYDNTYNLGRNTERWKDVYAVTYHGSASQTTLSTTATTDTTTYKPLVVDASGNQRRSSYWYGGGGGSTSPGGNSGNVQINRNGLFTAPGSDSLNFVGGLQIKGTLSVSALANAYGDKQVRWNSSTGSISYIDTLADLTFDNLGTGDTLLTNPSANTIGVKSLIAGTNVTFTVGANSITINSSGSGLTSSNFVFNEVPSGTINGTNTSFTIANTPTAGTVQLFLNGLLQRPTTDYTISGTTITMINIPGTGDFMLVHYLK